MNTKYSGISQLPPEILDRCLDSLHDDFRALRAAGLVCRAWAPRTRYHLYSAVYFQAQTVYTLYHIISSPLANIPSVIDSFGIGGLGNENLWPEKCLSTLMAYFKTVTKLLILNWIEARKPGAFWDTILRPGLDNFRTLRMTGVWVPSSTILKMMVLKSNRLQKLILNDVKLGTVTNDSSLVCPPIRALELIYCRNSVGPVLSWLTRNPTIVDLRITGITTVEQPIVQNFLNVCGASIRFLALGYNLWIGEFIPPMNLRANTSIEQLKIERINLCYYPMSSPAPPTHVGPIIASCISSRLKVIHLVIEVHELGYLAILDWEQIDARLAWGQVHLTVQAQGDSWKSTMGNIVQSRMPVGTRDCVVHLLGT